MHRLLPFPKRKIGEKKCYPQHGTLAWTYPHILALLVGLGGGGGGGQNTLLDNGNFKITNKGYAANLTSFWLGGPTHLHEMEATKRQTLCRNLFKDSRTVTGEFAFWSRVEGRG